MSDPQPGEAALDRAYAGGKLVGLCGLATSEGCPYDSDQASVRIAWLDGFADGAWERSARTGGRPAGIGFGRRDEDAATTASLAIAHLFRLSRCIRPDGTPGDDLGAALQAAAAFCAFAGLNVGP